MLLAFLFENHNYCLLVEPEGFLIYTNDNGPMEGVSYNREWQLCANYGLDVHNELIGYIHNNVLPH